MLPYQQQGSSAETNEIVHLLLDEYKQIMKINSTKKQLLLNEFENLTYKIVYTLRKSSYDHILMTTSLYILINILKNSNIDHTVMKNKMIHAGVQNILINILSKESIAIESTKQYANELCFYLW